MGKEIDVDINLHNAQNKKILIMPEDILTFTAKELLVYLILFDRSDSRLFVEFSIQALSKITRIGEKQVSQTIADLKEKKFLTETEHNLYSILYLTIDKGQYTTIDLDTMYNVIDHCPKELKSYNAYYIYLYILSKIWTPRGQIITMRQIADNVKMDAHTVNNYIDFIKKYFEVEEKTKNGNTVFNYKKKSTKDKKEVNNGSKE